MPHNTKIILLSIKTVDGKNTSCPVKLELKNMLENIILL